MGTRWVALSWLLLITAGCATSRVPAYTSFGLAWGRDADEAVNAALLVNEAAASVVRHLPGATLRPFDVVVVDTDDLASGSRAVGTASGATQRFANGQVRVLLTGVDGEEARGVAVHELVHAFVDPFWDGLPQVWEEAVADSVVCLDARSRGLTSDPDWVRVVLEQQTDDVRLALYVDGHLAASEQTLPGYRLAFDDLLANLELADEAMRPADEQNVAARATAFFAVQRLAGGEGLVGLRAFLESLDGCSRSELARALLARVGLVDVCDLVAAAREAIDPRSAEARARAFAASHGLDAWLTYAGQDAELLIVVDGVHHVRAEPDWFAQAAAE